MKRNGVHIHLYSNVEKVVAEDGRFSYLVMADGSKEEGDACIIATGGVSYQTTGSTGDGYRFAEAMGHKITEPAPSLVPMNVREEYIPALMGFPSGMSRQRSTTERKSCTVISEKCYSPILE